MWMMDGSIPSAVGLLWKGGRRDQYKIHTSITRGNSSDWLSPLFSFVCVLRVMTSDTFDLYLKIPRRRFESSSYPPPSVGSTLCVILQFNIIMRLTTTIDEIQKQPKAVGLILLHFILCWSCQSFRSCADPVVYTSTQRWVDTGSIKTKLQHSRCITCKTEIIPFSSNFLFYFTLDQSNSYQI